MFCSWRSLIRLHTSSRLRHCQCPMASSRFQARSLGWTRETLHVNFLSCSVKDVLLAHHEAHRATSNLVRRWGGGSTDKKDNQQESIQHTRTTQSNGVDKHHDKSWDATLTDARVPQETWTQSRNIWSLQVRQSSKRQVRNQCKIRHEPAKTRMEWNEKRLESCR